MANVAILASGNGSNFQAIAERLERSPHTVSCMISDRKDAFAFERARELGIPAYHVSYRNRTREDAEREILALLRAHRIELIVLAGFMRLVSPFLVDSYPDRIINIHPSLLPKYPGTNAIEESFASGDPDMGITIHRVDYGTDTGPIILQRTLKRVRGESLHEAEQRIHELEHQSYPEVVMNILDKIEKTEQPLRGSDRRTL